MATAEGTRQHCAACGFAYVEGWFYLDALHPTVPLCCSCADRPARSVLEVLTGVVLFRDAVYQARLNAGLCVHGRCKRARALNRVRCEYHLAVVARAVARFKARKAAK